MAYGKTWGTRNFAEVLRSLERALTAHGRRHGLRRRQWPAAMTRLCGTLGSTCCTSTRSGRRRRAPHTARSGTRRSSPASPRRARRCPRPRSCGARPTRCATAASKIGGRSDIRARVPLHAHLRVRRARGGHPAQVRESVQCERRHLRRHLHGPPEHARAARDEIAALRGVAPPEVRVLDAFQVSLNDDPLRRHRRRAPRTRCCRPAQPEAARH